MTPVEARKTSEGLQPAAMAVISAVSRGRLASGLAGERIGIARIDHEGARAAALDARAAPIDRSGGTFRAREHAGRHRARVEERQQHVGAAGIADAGGRGRQPHAFDRRHVGKVRGRERGDGGCHGSASMTGRPCPGTSPTTTPDLMSDCDKLVTSSARPPACRGARSWRSGAAWRHTRSAPCARESSRSGPSPWRIPAAAWFACPRP